MSLDNIRIVLAGTIYGGNVGSVCRAMANTGLSDLALVLDRQLDMQEARTMACSADSILNSRKEYSTLAEAVADCGLVMGATARPGLYRSHALTPRELAPKILETAHDQKVALVFGREDKGLFNDEIALCTQIIRIPSAPSYPSINLAQAVMICCYEIYVASGRFVPPQEKSPEAPSDLRERMFALWREALFRIGFMDEGKANHMMFGLRRVLSRGKLTVEDVKILMGMARQTLFAAENMRTEDKEKPAP